MSRPRNIESHERAVIGAILRKPSVFHDIDLQVPEFSTRWRKVYAATCDAVYNGEPVDSVTLAAASGFDGADISKCMSFCTDPERVARYAETVREFSLDRSLREFGRELAREAEYGNDLLALVQNRIAALGLTQSSSDASSAGEVSKRVLDIAERRYAGDDVKVGDFTLGLPPLDAFLALRRGNAATIAGRPSMGKTAFALWLIVAMIMRGERVLMFSTESTEDEILQRIHSMLIGVSAQRIAQRRLEYHELERLREADKLVDSWPLWIDDTSTRINDVQRQVRRYKLRERITVVVADHLQEFSATSERGGKLYDRAKLDAVIEGLRDVSREDPKVLLLMLSQLNRDVEKREDKRPLVSDVKESGKIEEASHMILLLYRAAVYSKEAREQHPWKMQVAIGKNRNGPTGRVLLHWADKLGCVRGVYDELMDLWELDPFGSAGPTHSPAQPPAPEQTEL